jgi:alkaline phosphatase
MMQTTLRRILSLRALLIAVPVIVSILLGWRVAKDYGTETLPSLTAPGRPDMAPLSASASARPRNIVLMIADGAGVTHYTAARIYLVGRDGKLAVDLMPVVGLVTNHSANRLVTDSAAAATAMATGHKTNNGFIGFDPDGQPMHTFFEDARAGGKSTGIVVTTEITDATAAVFYAHVKDRRFEEEVAEQLPGSGLDLVLGSGYWEFIPESKGGARLDGKDLIPEISKHGYHMVRTRSELLAAGQDNSKLLGLFRPSEIAAGGSGPSLHEMVDVALERLNRNPQGFVLMIEGSLIDTESHARNIRGALAEMQGFDQAVLSVLKFAQRQQDTLVVVTSDHETGGLLIKDPVIGQPDLDLKTSWNSGLRKASHTGGMVALYSYGPGSADFAGTYDNTAIAQKIFRNLH